MNLHSCVLFVHIGSAVVLLANSLTSPFVRSSMRRAATVGELSGWLEFLRRTTRFDPAVAVVVLASGVYLGSVGWWSSGWFRVSMVLFFVNGLFAAKLVVRELGRIRDAAANAGDGPIADAIDELRRSERLDLGSDILLAVDLVVLFLMVEKPTLPVSGALGLAAIGSAFAVRLVRRRLAAAPASVDRLSVV